MQTLAKDHFAEILVCCKQQSSFAIGQIQNLIVRHAWPQFHHTGNRMTVLPQTLHDRQINTLVSQEFHGVVSDRG